MIRPTMAHKRHRARTVMLKVTPCEMRAIVRRLSPDGKRAFEPSEQGILDQLIEAKQIMASAPSTSKEEKGA